MNRPARFPAVVYNGGMDDLALNSKAYYLWNDTLGVVIEERAADEVVPVASLTKIMTALITLEQRGLDEIVTITPEMLSGLEEFAIVGLQIGQKLTVEELLYATMLPSAGDAAQALAISTSGSIQDFAEAMNARARELGMSRTQFSNPVGFDEENYSTPHDIALLLKEALNNPRFREIFETREKYLPSLGRSVKKTFALEEPITGGKTGFTNAAGRCLASAATVEGADYILVTVGAAVAGQNVDDAKAIYQMVADEYEPARIVAAEEKILSLGVEGSPEKVIDFRADQERTVALKNGTTTEDLTYNYDGLGIITRETPAGSKLGEYTIRQGETTLYTQEIYYQEAPEFYDYNYVWGGAAVSLGMLVLAIVGAVKRKWALAWLGGILMIASVGVGYWGFRKWFEPAPAMEIYATEVVQENKN